MPKFDSKRPSETRIQWNHGQSILAFLPVATTLVETLVKITKVAVLVMRKINLKGAWRNVAIPVTVKRKWKKLNK